MHRLTRVATLRATNFARPISNSSLLRPCALVRWYNTKVASTSRSRVNVRRIGQEQDAGSFQNLLKRVMEIDAEINNTPITEAFKPRTLQCKAYCTAEEYNIPALKQRLEEKKTSFKVMPLITADMIHIEVVDHGGEIFAFSNGTYVTWGVQDAKADEFLNECIRASSVQVNPIAEIETEDAEFVLDTDEPTGMKGDIILINPVLPAPTLSKISFSHGLARSAKLAVLEDMLEKYLSSTKPIPALMLHGKKIPLTRREILMKLGELLSFRQQLNLSAGESFLDTPDFYWARPELEEYYNKISRHLDVRPRIAILNKKLDYANELATILREHLSEKHSLTLEWMIIILITVEVAFEGLHWILGHHQQKRRRASSALAEQEEQIDEYSVNSPTVV